MAACSDRGAADGESGDCVWRRVSLANRDLTFPNTREAGLEVGRGIVADCTADPHGLLFASVDAQVRKVSKAAATR